MSKKQVKKKKGASRRPTKKEIEKQKAVKRLIFAICTVFIFFIGMMKLGNFGITVYNVMRLFVGGLAYPAMLALIIYLLASKRLRKYDGLIFGFIVTFLGFLIEWHAVLFSNPALKGKSVFAMTSHLLMADLLHLKVSHFVGGGFLGALIYSPVAFLFSNVGSYMIGGIFIILGLYLMSPWDLMDVLHYSMSFYHWCQVKIELSNQKRFLKREDKKKAAEESMKDTPEFSDQNDEISQEDYDKPNHLIVDYETGEIVDQIDYIPEIKEADKQEGYDDEGTTYELDDELFSDTKSSIRYSNSNDNNSLSFTSPKNLHYQLPSINLFAAEKSKGQSKEKYLVRRNISLLEDTFKSFGIEVKVERAEIGPSVTKYEVKPAVGIRVNRISNLADDLALALASKDVRIEAPIPGKSLVGIEVPNSEVATVSFRELWEQSKTPSNQLLEIPLGKAVNGTVKTFDLTRMPHLLVAGSTGSGKSVAVNGIIASILMKAKPDQVKFLMIDPKMVELSVYNDIPHLLIPVVTNPRKASKALQKVVDEMENRYELFSHIGVRNIETYNQKVTEFNKQSQEKQIPLPIIVVIVDELADLMMVASKEVENAIIRLGQKARAAGIHMILATQRPSVDVISGLIKANVPSRIAFAVSSGTDSRTILDENGAEKLLGRGDMLFKPITENHPVRLQGSFISDNDVERIVDFIKSQSEADYDDSFDPGEISESEENSNDSNAQDGDPLFDDAKRLVLETQKASASMLQRRLSVGFNRATRLMEELEEAGVIGPAEGTKPRRVLMTLDN